MHTIWKMADTDKVKEPFEKPNLRINLKEKDRRTGQKDRRKIHTYIANDRRSGIADRRKKSDEN
ncbi:MAG: hypothetical protein ACXACY_26535 [Candidatus Hodarchaeales archaeon]|jgi:hypothetical protein